MKADFTPAYILHSRAYRETSLLLDVFSRDEGRISLIAKGAKRKNSDKAGLLQPYQRLLISWSGKSELMTLTGAEADKSIGTIHNKRLIVAFYLNELVIRLLHQHEAHPDLFEAYDGSLLSLADHSVPIQMTIRKFEKQLLQAIGYGPVFDHDVSTGHAIKSGQSYYYLADRGPVTHQPGHTDFIKVTGESLLAMSQDFFPTGETEYEAKKLMRYLIGKHLGDKPLASRALYRSYINIP